MEKCNTNHFAIKILMKFFCFIVNFNDAKKINFTLFPFKSAADGGGKFEDKKEP